MIKEVAKNIFTFPVTLPNNPLKELNVFVVKGENRTVLFDTGFNTLESKEDLLNGLDALNVKLEDLDVVLTHLHADHVGLVNLFVDAGCTIYTGSVDGEIMNQMATGKYFEVMKNSVYLYGMAQDFLNMEGTQKPGKNLSKPVDYVELEIGDFLTVGDYSFEVLDLSGHTPGHLGFYDEKSKIILSADTILDPITPNITFWGFEYPDILNTYIETLLSLKKLNLKLALATHRKIVTNVNERIDEIIYHHNERLQEILDVMKKDTFYTVREISSNLSWRIPIDNWEDFPQTQKWFAAGETMAHLHHLANKKDVEMIEEEGILKFRKIQATSHDFPIN